MLIHFFQDFPDLGLPKVLGALLASLSAIYNGLKYEILGTKNMESVYSSNQRDYPTHRTKLMEGF